MDIASIKQIVEVLDLSNQEVLAYAIIFGIPILLGLLVVAVTFFRRRSRSNRWK